MSKDSLKTLFTFIELNVKEKDVLSKTAIAFPYAIRFNQGGKEAINNVIYAAMYGLYMNLQLPENKLYSQIIDSL